MTSKQSDLLCYFKHTKNAHKLKSTKDLVDKPSSSAKEVLVKVKSTNIDLCKENEDKISKESLDTNSFEVRTSEKPIKKVLAPRKNDSCSSSKRKKCITEETDHFSEESCSSLDKISKNLVAYPKKKRLKVDESNSLTQKSENNVTEVNAKLNPDEIKKLLGKCSNLAELKSKFLKSSDIEKQLQQFKAISSRKEGALNFSSSPQKICLSPRKVDSSLRGKLASPKKLDSSVRKQLSSPYKANGIKSTGTSSSKISHPQLEQFKSLELDVPLSPSKSPAKLLSKSPQISKPAYQRFGDLAKPTLAENQLVLPHKYQVVREAFRAVDTLVSLLHNRQETITFSKLKSAVQEMMRAAFSENNLGQIKRVFPLGYFFKQEKVRQMNECGINETSYQLTVTPNFEYKEKKVVKNLMEKFDATTLCKYRKMDSVVLVDRRHVFHNALLDIVKKHHDKFLQTLDYPIKADGPLQNWHPEFPLDDLEPIEADGLPQPPTQLAPKSAKDIIESAQYVFSTNNRMKKVLTEAATKLSSPTKEKGVPVVVKPEIEAALKGVSLSLLQKIRSREAAKLARDMSRSPAASHELTMLSRLPELVRILRNIFVGEKKAALPWDLVVTKVSQSHSNMMSPVEVEAHIRLLMKEIPTWCQLHKVRSGEYLKLDKKCQVNDVLEKLQVITKERS